MSWHVLEPTIDAYVTGRLDDASAFSLEAHVLTCSVCRDALSARAGADRHERIWTGVRDAIERPKIGVDERALIAIGIRDDIARLLAATPVLRTSWLGAVAATLAFAVLMSRTTGSDVLPFLALAPLVPVAGVAVAFRRPADPAWELGLSTPVGGFRLMLIRAAAVFAVSVTLAGLAVLALPSLGWTAAGWVLPAFALTVLTLALSSTSIPAATAAGIVAGGWASAVLVADRLAREPLAPFGSTAQVGFALLAVASTTILIARHTSFERPSQI